MGTLPLPNNKPALRQWAKERRATLPMATLSRQIVGHLSTLPALQTAGAYLIYSAMENEVDLAELLDVLPGQAYLPRCAPKRRLAIHAYCPGETPLRPGPFGIPEPDAAHVPEEDPTILDVVVVPALLLTPHGDRLGYGGGYYDRFLPRLRLDCLTIGALPNALLVPQLPTDTWDVPLRRVVTEAGA